MLWWNRNTLCQHAGYRDDPTTDFGIVLPCGAELWEKSALSKQLTGGEGGTNRENYPAALDTQEVGFLG